jgi:DNA-binding IclR family transcriptional regulator
MADPVYDHTKAAREVSAPVGAVASAARILGYLGAAPAPLRLTQICRPLGINASTCLNILRTLAAEGFVRVDAASKTYGLGRRIVELARDALSHGENLGALRPAMEALARRYGITIMLWGRLDPEHLILLATAVGEPLRSIHAELGMRVPLLTGSMGRIFAGELDGETLRRQFDAVVWQKPIDFETYLREVEITSGRGWALDAGYFNTAMWGISVPASRRGAQVDQVINAVLLADQHDSATIDRIAQDLLAVGGANGIRLTQDSPRE